MLSVAIFAGLWYWFVKTDIGYGITHAIRQPLFVALPIGLIMGDLQQALIVGAAVQILYIGLVAAGSNLPADDALAGLIAIPLALATGLSPELAVAIAVPIGIAGVFIDQLRKTVNIIWVHLADRYAANASTRGIFLANFVYPTILGFFLRFPIVFFAVYFGADAVESVLDAVPEWLLHGFSVAGGLLPALGFALVIFVIGRRDLLPWFFIGYFFVAYSSIPVLGAAIFGVCVVLLIAGYTRSRNVSAVEAEERPSADDRAAHSPEPERGPGNTTTTDAELAPGADGIPTLTEKDVRKSWFRYYLFAETGISYERLQALGFTHGLLPILKKLYPKKADLSAAMQRHLVFYNTEAVFGAPINGVVISMEEQRAHGKPITDDAITGIKTGLMGPMAGLGDSIDWATMKPLIFALAAALGATGNIFAPFILLLLPLFQIIVGLNLATTGYRQGRSSIQDLLRSGRVKELITGASTLGLFMMGVLSATYISLTTPLSFQFGDGNEPFVVQDILDGLAPGILPLLVVLGLYFTLRRRKQNLGLIALILVAIALLGALAGIF